MNCKFCQHMLEEGNLICPNCGKDNAEEILEEVTQPEVAELIPAAEEAPVEAAVPEERKGIFLTPGKLAAIIVGAVLLTALVVGLVLQGMGFSFTQEATEPTDAAASGATVPADGDPENVTAKGTYTVSDEEIVEAMDTVVATAGEAELTNSMLQIFYWTQVQNFVAQNGTYAYYYYGFDYTQPLDTQIYPLDDRGITWQQYFLEAALSNWHTYQAMATESLQLGFALDAEIQAQIDSLPTSMATDAGLQGFDSAESYLAYSLGLGADLEDYAEYMELYYQGYTFFQAEYEKMQPTGAEVEAYFNEHESDYAAEGISRDTVTVDVRHILIMPEGATTDTIYTETFSEEAWAAGKAKAQEILDEWAAGDATEESFALLANTYSADGGSNTNGGLYEGVEQGEMVTNFDAWCFDPERKVGDCEIVETEYGYHIIYFCGSTPLWPEYAKSDLLSEQANTMMMGIVDKYPLEVDYPAIKLGFVNMGA